MKTVALYNIKGGVGKTASAVNLAHLSAGEGRRTLVWDLDPQGAASFYFRVKPRVKQARKLFRKRRALARAIHGTDFPGLDLLPADFSHRRLDLTLDAFKKPRRRLERLLRSLDGEYDYVFIDCAPSISVASESVFAAADVLLVPTPPTTLALRTLRQLTRHLKRIPGPRPRVLAFFCLVDSRKALHREICRRSSAPGATLLTSRIPYSSAVERMGLHRAPLATFAAQAEPTRAYRALWGEIRRELARG